MPGNTPQDDWKSKPDPASQSYLDFDALSFPSRAALLIFSSRQLARNLVWGPDSNVRLHGHEVVITSVAPRRGGIKTGCGLSCPTTHVSKIHFTIRKLCEFEFAAGGANYSETGPRLAPQFVGAAFDPGADRRLANSTPGCSYLPSGEVDQQPHRSTDDMRVQRGRQKLTERSSCVPKCTPASDVVCSSVVVQTDRTIARNDGS